MRKNNSHLEETRPRIHPKDDAKTSAKTPPDDEQNQATVDDFGREGMGVSGKE